MSTPSDELSSGVGNGAAAAAAALVGGVRDGEGSSAPLLAGAGDRAGGAIVVSRKGTFTKAHQAAGGGGVRTVGSLTPEQTAMLNAIEFTLKAHPEAAFTNIKGLLSLSRKPSCSSRCFAMTLFGTALVVTIVGDWVPFSAASLDPEVKEVLAHNGLGFITPKTAQGGALGTNGVLNLLCTYDAFQDGVRALKKAKEWIDNNRRTRGRLWGDSWVGTKEVGKCLMDAFVAATGALPYVSIVDGENGVAPYGRPDADRVEKTAYKYAGLFALMPVFFGSASILRADMQLALKNLYWGVRTTLPVELFRCGTNPEKEASKRFQALTEMREADLAATMSQVFDHFTALLAANYEEVFIRYPAEVQAVIDAARGANRNLSGGLLTEDVRAVDAIDLARFATAFSTLYQKLQGDSVATPTLKQKMAQLIADLCTKGLAVFTFVPFLGQSLKNQWVLAILGDFVNILFGILLNVSTAQSLAYLLRGILPESVAYALLSSRSEGSWTRHGAWLYPIANFLLRLWAVTSVGTGLLSLRNSTLYRIQSDGWKTALTIPTVVGITLFNSAALVESLRRLMDRWSSGRVLRSATLVRDLPRGEVYLALRAALRGFAQDQLRLPVKEKLAILAAWQHGMGIKLPAVVQRDLAGRQVALSEEATGKSRTLRESALASLGILSVGKHLAWVNTAARRYPSQRLVGAALAAVITGVAVGFDRHVPQPAPRVGELMLLPGMNITLLAAVNMSSPTNTTGLVDGENAVRELVVNIPAGWMLSYLGATAIGVLISLMASKCVTPGDQARSSMPVRQLCLNGLYILMSMTLAVAALPAFFTLGGFESVTERNIDGMLKAFFALVIFKKLFLDIAASRQTEVAAASYPGDESGGAVAVKGDGYYGTLSAAAPLAGAAFPAGDTRFEDDEEVATATAAAGGSGSGSGARAAARGLFAPRGRQVGVAAVRGRGDGVIAAALLSGGGAAAPSGRYRL